MRHKPHDYEAEFEFILLNSMFWFVCKVVHAVFNRIVFNFLKSTGKERKNILNSAYSVAGGILKYFKY